MTKSSFHKLLLGSVLMLLPFAVQAQVVLKNWTIEDHSGKVKILVSSDTLEITAPDGLTLWYNQRLTGDYEIGYRVKMLMQGGKYDRLSDLNCFGAPMTRNTPTISSHAANGETEFSNVIKR